ncbi:MAG: deoxyribonuclease IV [Anaerolineae bacterium]|nr:deoxyribonuclease IV [Anaerolineae bacterium]
MWATLDRASSIGSNAVQVFTKNNRQWKGPPIDKDDVARWQDEMEPQGILYAVSHASYLINLASPKDDLWERSINAHKDELERAHAYGIPHVVLHPGAHTGSGEEAGIDRIAAALNRIHAETPDCADTKTLLELMAGQGTTLGRTLGQLRAIIDRVDEGARVGVCLDTCHAFAAGYDLASEAATPSSWMRSSRRLGWMRWAVGTSTTARARWAVIWTGTRTSAKAKSATAKLRFILNDARWDGIAMLLETPKDDDLADDVRNLAHLVGLVDDADRIPPGLDDD